MSAEMIPGYFTYGFGPNQTVHYLDDGWPPKHSRWDPEAENWVDTGPSFTILDRAVNGDADGPFPRPPTGVPPAPNEVK